jgi:hypothetical protein
MEAPEGLIPSDSELVAAAHEDAELRVNMLTDELMPMTVVEPAAFNPEALSDEGKTETPDDGLDTQYGEGMPPAPPPDDRDGIEYILKLEHELNTKTRRLFDTQSLIAAMLRVNGPVRLERQMLLDADPNDVVITSGFDGAVTFSLRGADDEAQPQE